MSERKTPEEIGAELLFVGQIITLHAITEIAAAIRADREQADARIAELEAALLTVKMFLHNARRDVPGGFESLHGGDWKGWFGKAERALASMTSPAADAAPSGMAGTSAAGDLSPDPPGRCPDCRAPLATDNDSDCPCGTTESCERCNSLCWREWYGDECQRDPAPDPRDALLRRLIEAGRIYKALEDNLRAHLETKP